MAYRFSSVLPTAIVAAVLLASSPAEAVGAFSPSVFPFTIKVQDDGTGAAGGWQEASALLKFVDTRPLPPRLWSCRITVGMPLRAATHGRISPAFAAGTAASVATEASTKVMHRQPEWMTAEFCVAFVAEMNSLFLKDHRSLGARVNGP